MLLKDIIEEFLLELDIRGASKEAIRSYTDSLKIFSDYIGEIEVEKIKAVHVKGFAKFNKDRGLKQKTQNGYISAVRALYSYMIEEEIVTKNLGYSVKLVNATDKKEIEVFTSEEIKRLVGCMKKGTQKDNKYIVARDNLIINFLLETGCRNHELTNLKECDIEDGQEPTEMTFNTREDILNWLELVGLI